MNLISIEKIGHMKPKSTWDKEKILKTTWEEQGILYSISNNNLNYNIAINRSWNLDDFIQHLFFTHVSCP